MKKIVAEGRAPAQHKLLYTHARARPCIVRRISTPARVAGEMKEYVAISLLRVLLFGFYNFESELNIGSKREKTNQKTTQDLSVNANV